MQKLFTKILIPVVFNGNTGWSVDKAIQLANKFDCDILLLHVQPPPVAIPFLGNAFFSAPFTNSMETTPEKKMKDLELQSKPMLKEGLLMTSAVLEGYWEPVLKDVIISEHIDLALIPQNYKRVSAALIYRININKLSQQTNCPILTITPNLNANHFQNIVVPVHNLLPVKKLAIATYLSLESSGCIYLMGKNTHPKNKMGESLLMKAYQLLNDFGTLNIHCALREN
ncbi:MAG: universal stress protein, partial [Bacteroidota bacterium]